MAMAARRLAVLTILVAVAVLTATASAHAQALFAWEQARMKAAAQQRAALERSPYYRAQAFQRGWPSPSFARPELWLPARQGDTSRYGRYASGAPVRRPAPGWWPTAPRCDEDRWEVVGRWYETVPRWPYFLRSGRIERDRCLHEWLRAQLWHGRRAWRRWHGRYWRGW